MATIRVAPLQSVLATDGPPRVLALMDHLSTESGIDARWNDEGNEVLRQEWDAFDLHAVRSLAAHVDYPPSFLGFHRKFKLLDDPRNSKSLRRIFDGGDTSFPHMMRHSDNKGLWVPPALPQPVAANEADWWMVGSVPGVLEELGRVRPLVDDGGPRLQQSHQALVDLFEAAHNAGLPVVID